MRFLPHPNGQKLECLGGLDGQKHGTCSDHPDGQNVLTIWMVRSIGHLDGQKLECLGGLGGQKS